MRKQDDASVSFSRRGTSVTDADLQQLHTAATTTTEPMWKITAIATTTIALLQQQRQHACHCQPAAEKVVCKPMFISRSYCYIVYSGRGVGLVINRFRSSSTPCRALIAGLIYFDGWPSLCGLCKGHLGQLSRLSLRGRQVNRDLPTPAALPRPQLQIAYTGWATK